VATALLIAPVVKVFVDVFREFGVRITVTSGTRSSEKQVELYQGRATNPYPVARPGRSQHEFGVAVDMVASPREAQSLLGEVWGELGLYWSASDQVHFQVFTPVQWSQVLSLLQGAQPASAPVLVEQPPVYRVTPEYSGKWEGQPMFPTAPLAPTFPAVDGGPMLPQEPLRVPRREIPEISAPSYLGSPVPTEPTVSPQPSPVLRPRPVPTAGILPLPLPEIRFVPVETQIVAEILGQTIVGKQYPRKSDSTQGSYPTYPGLPR